MPKPNIRQITRASAILQEGVEAAAMPGGVVCVFRHCDLLLHHAFGTLDGIRPASTETIYDLASLTKPLATAPCLIALVEAGQITLTATLGEFFGERATSLQKVTVHQLLTHTSGLPAWTPCYDSGLGHDAAIDAILHLPTAPPGSKYEYSCLGFILLHRIIEMVGGVGLSDFARDHLFTPLGLDSLAYCPDSSHSVRIAPTISLEGPDKNTVLVGKVHDGNARGMGGVSGNAGLFGTALDVARFGEVLRKGGTDCPFGAPTLARIFTNQVKPDIGFHTLFFFAQGNGYCPAGDLLSPQAVGHSGFTGTLLTIDPTYDLTVALLTNSVYGDTTTAPSTKARFLSYRRRFLNALAASLD